MKPLIYFSLLLLTLGCDSIGTKSPSIDLKDTLSQANDLNTLPLSDTAMQSKSTTHEVTYPDSIIAWYEKKIKEIKPKLISISRKKYQELQQQKTKICASDTGDFLLAKGLRYHQTCDEVCSSFLTDLKNGVRMVVPATYDAGLRGMVVSPECSRIAFYSSYDGIDYSDYYEYCSEIYFYHVHEGSGIQTLQPAWVYFTKAFTITEMFWINENTIILKTYAEDRHQVSEDKLNFRYYQAALPAH